MSDDNQIHKNNLLVRKIWQIARHYNHEKYWAMRKEVINPDSKVIKLLKYYYLYRIKKMDFYNNASMSTQIGSGAKFETPPILPHGLNGIIIHSDVTIGKNVTILHQVTIGGGKGELEIGDNALLGAGCKILTGGKIGNNVNVGANAVVTHPVPSNCSVAGIPARIINLDGKRVDISLKDYNREETY